MTVATKYKPILFSTDMTLAIRRGRKNQTRRVIVPQPEIAGEFFGIPQWHWRKKSNSITTTIPEAFGFLLATFADFRVGDILWVRESIYYDILPWAEGGSLKDKPLDFDPEALYYRADGTCCEQIPECACAEVGKTRWRSARFMPRWAARTFIEITNVRCQRVQEISEVDAIAEGTSCWMCGGPVDGTCINDCSCFHNTSQAVTSFEVLWDSINSKRGFSWESDPWVWVYDFKVLSLDGEPA